MSEDKELERLKAKRFAEMQKNISSKSDKPSPREALVKKLGYRGLEVLKNAETQFPNETKIIIDQLGNMIISREINEMIDGGQLLFLFKTVGIYIRMETKINVQQDGKLVSLSDKLRSK